MATAKQPCDELTLPELVAALPGLLAEGYDGARSGRVRDLPDARTVRWYQTLGMVDRPAGFRGRTALFGRHHLLQLAAIKKLQARGLPLADIQRGLAGRNDAELARSAGVAGRDVDRVIEQVVLARSRATATTLAAASTGTAPAEFRRQSEFWKARPAAVAAAAPASAPSAPRGMQSATLGRTAMLLWSGREPSPAERVTLARLAEPLVEFLESLETPSGADPAGVPPLAPGPGRRPGKGVHP